MANIITHQTSLREIKLEWRKFLYLSAFLIAVIFMSGCNGVETTRISVSDTPLPPTMTQIPEIHQPTSKPSGTATATQNPTWTPVATLPVEIRKQNLIELFSTNGGCNFPCWWDISPGDSIQKVSELAPVVGKSLRHHESFFYYTLSLDDLNLADFDVNYYVDGNQIVQRMKIVIEKPSRFRDYHIAFGERLSLSGLLNNYGKPSEVLLLVAPLGGPGIPREYALFLIYDTQDFGVVYIGLVDSEDPIRICSIKMDDYHLQSVLLYLHDPRQKIAELNRFYMHTFKPLDEVTSMSLDDFYQTFSIPSNIGCIETTIDKWP